MTNCKTTKRAFLASIMALILCFAMLLGTTYAWFTDSVTSGRNIIVSGNLDIELDYWVDGDWVSVDGKTEIFDREALWEPGYTEVVYLKLSNVGSLALKYQLGINILSETTGTNVYDETFKLSDHIRMGVVENINGENGAYSKDKVGRAQAIADAEDAVVISSGYAKDGSMTAGADDLYLAVVVYMPESVDNVANHKTGTEAPSIELGINLVATQFTYEEDSFDNTYDENAQYIISDKENMIFAGNVFDKAVVNYGSVEMTGGSITASQAGFDNYGEAVLNDVVIDAGSAADYSNRTIGAGANTEYNDVEINSKGGGIAAADGAQVTFNSGSVYVDTASTSGRYIFYAEGAGTVITINGGSFSWDKNDNQKRAYIYAGEGTTVYVTGGTFGKASTRSGYTAGILGPGNVVITGGTFGFDPSAWVAGGYEAVKSGSTWTVQPTGEDLAIILTSNKKNIVVNLSADVDLPITSLGQITPGSGEYKLGGADTEEIVINLNGHKLNITTTYWSAIGAVNADATITIKNGSMTSTGNSAGTWNAYDVRLCNCNYVIEDVVFDKAVAIDNAGKSTTMNNVTINEQSGDKYALWITAEGQNVTIDGLTVNSTGRGIKIDEQYVDAATKVTLNVSNATFNTVKKAAIMVKSLAGADITLDNIDISGVAADTTNAVWNDSDAAASFDKVTVTGGSVIQEA